MIPGNPMRVSALLFCLLTAGSCWSQIADLDPDWKELEVPPPAKFSAERMVPIEMPRYVTVKVGVDPESLSIGADGIVRYVLIAQSSNGNINAMYEGIWCRKGEVKTYARLASDGKWDPVDDAQWSPLNGNLRSMHALAFARQGACDGRATAARTPQEIIRRLKRSQFDGIQN